MPTSVHNRRRLLALVFCFLILSTEVWAQVASVTKFGNGCPSFSSSLIGNGNAINSVHMGDDINGDGIRDMAFGMANANKVFVWFMDATASSIKSFQNIDNTCPGLTSIPGGQSFGVAVHIGGDINGDGIPEIGIGATENDDGGNDRGAIYIMFPNRDATIKSFAKISSTTAEFLGQLGTTDYFGQGISFDADINLDGYLDLAVSSIFDDNTQTNSGALYIYFLNNAAIIKSYKKIKAPTIVNSEAFAWHLSFNKGSDGNGDGIPDLAASVRWAAEGGYRRGAVYIVFIDRTGTAASFTKISGIVGGYTGVVLDSDMFGFQVHFGTDLNGDGSPDLIAGQPFADDGVADAGAVNILFLQRPDCSVKSSLRVSATSGGLSSYVTLASGDAFGQIIGPAYDVDGDGVPELIVGSNSDDTYGLNRGSIMIIKMNPSTSGIATDKDECFLGTHNCNSPLTYCTNTIGSFTCTCVNSANCPTIYNSTIRLTSPTLSGFTAPLQNGGYLVMTSTGGDVNGDGIRDMVIGQQSYAEGQAFLLFMDPSGKTVKSFYQYHGATPGLTSMGLSSGISFSVGSSLGGDVNGDGVPDLAIAACGYSSYLGEVFILFLNTDGSVRSYSTIRSGLGGFTAILPGGGVFGSDVSLTTDVNGDGVLDLAVGAMGEDAVYMIFLGTDGLPKSHFKTTSSSVFSSASATGVHLGLGLSMSKGSDINGDGVPDIIVGARVKPDGGSQRGAVFILFIDRDGTMKSYTKISSGNGGLTAQLNNGDLFGTSVAVAGDLNGDGCADLVVGAAGSIGSVYVFFLIRGAGTVKSHIKISSGASSPIPSPNLQADDGFGRGVAAPYDLDGNGTPDLVVASSGDDWDGGDRGAAYVLLSNVNGPFAKDVDECFMGTHTCDSVCTNTIGSFICLCPGLVPCSTPSNIVKLIPPGLNDGGMARGLGIGGDINGDGARDLAVGQTSGGVVSIMFLSANGLTIKSSTTISSSTPGFTSTYTTVNERFGEFVSLGGDTNSDGIPDLVATSCAASEGGSGRGAAFLLFLNTAGGVKSFLRVSSSSYPGMLQDGDYFGHSTNLHADVNGDGAIDWTVGCIFDGSAVSQGGSVIVFFLSTVGTVKSYARVGGTAAAFSGLFQAGWAFGAAHSIGGDGNGDGIPDLAASVPGASDGGPSRGAIMITFLSRDGGVKSYARISSTYGGFTGKFYDGTGIENVDYTKDLNGDGAPDLVFGVVGDNDGGPSRGAVYVCFMTRGTVTVKSSFKISSLKYGMPGRLSDGDEFGHGLGTMDLNGDGHVDLAVVARHDSVAGYDRGTIYILFGDTSASSDFPLDDDECGLGTHTCDPMASVCTNNIGGFSCGCFAGYGGWGDACIACAVGMYKSSEGSTLCNACPSFSTTVSTGSTSIASCVCNAGYSGSNGACTECGAGSYKSSVGAGSCVSCSPGAFTTASAASRSSACGCVVGYGGSNGGCVACSPGQYKNSFGPSPCRTCTAGSTSSAGSFACECIPGQMCDTCKLGSITNAASYIQCSMYNLPKFL